MTSPAHARPEVEVFWRPGCPFCAALRTSLRLLRVRATWRTIHDDAEARDIVRAANGGDETVPTVRIGEVTLTNPTGREVSRLARG